MAASLALDNLTLAYGDRTVLTGVSLEVAAGDFAGFIGPNACGKSTLLKAISRVLRPAAGRVVLDGRDVWREMTLPETARTVAVVPQDFPACFPFTVAETVALGRTPYVSRLRGEQPRDLARVSEAMRATGTFGLKDRVLSELAGGDRQRVILAKALAQEPSLLLLDEPTSHLDINHQVEVLDLLLELNRSGGLTVVSVLHDLNLASIYCDYLFLLGGGGLVAHGRPREVLTAENLELVYGSRVLVDRHPVYDCPQIALVSQLRGGDVESGDGFSRVQDRPAVPSPVKATTGRQRACSVHVVGGGGSSGELLETLAAAGYSVTAGPLNAGDSDWHVGRTLGADLVTVPPFSALDREALAAAARLMKRADAVLVGPVPFGHGNVAVLGVVLEAARAGRPVGVVVEGKGKPAGGLGAVLAERDFAGGRAVALGAELDGAGAIALAGTRQALDWVSGLVGDLGRPSQSSVTRGDLR